LGLAAFKPLLIRLEGDILGDISRACGGRRVAADFFKVMPTGEENTGTALAKSAERLQWIRLRWAHTTAPETPFVLPALVRVNVTPSAIEIHPELTAGPSDEEADDVHFPKDEIISVVIILWPDDSDPRGEYLHGGVASCSRAVVRHRDRFGVVPFFESTFASNKSYWLKALAKALKEWLGIEAIVKSGEIDDSDLPF